MMMGENRRWTSKHQRDKSNAMMNKKKAYGSAPLTMSYSMAVAITVTIKDVEKERIKPMSLF